MMGSPLRVPSFHKHFTFVGLVAVKELADQLEANPQLWDEYGWRKRIPGGPHGGMSDIWVRYNAYEKCGQPGFTDEHDSLWYPAYDALPALKPILFGLMATVQGERLGGVLITRIPHGEGIKLHVDRGWHVEYYDKFYVSIASAPGAKFIHHDTVNDELEALEPQRGEIWHFDNRKPHSVENQSGQDRITLIACIRTEKYHGRHGRAA